MNRKVADWSDSSGRIVRPLVEPRSRQKSYRACNLFCNQQRLDCTALQAIFTLIRLDLLNARSLHMLIQIMLVGDANVILPLGQANRYSE